MAKRLNYTIGVDADTSKFEASINTALSKLNQLGTSARLTDELKGASQAALELSGHLNKALNKETGKLDLTVFNQSIASSGQTLESYATSLMSLGPAGEQAFLKVATAITQSELPLRRTNKLFDQLWTTMKNTMRWQLTSSVLHGFVGALEQAYGYTKDLDRSLNEIRIVSGQSAEDMAQFAEQANKAAKALSTTTTDYTDASLIYYQQGLSDQEVLDRTETTIKMANVAGTSAETASQQLTAIWNNFYDGSESLEHYADVLVKLGAATASSSDEISEGIEKFAAVANTVGLSYEYAASALATVTAQTRESASVVGTAFRTLFSRIQGLQQGETLDDGTTLNKYSQALANVGVQIKDASGELKGMDEILDDLGGKWDTLAQDQKIALAETVAGVRQWTQLIALMDNWDFFKENLALAENADGALTQQADIYAESWEAARDRTKAAAEDIYDSLINPNFYIGVDNVITPLLSRTADVIDALGGLKGILAVVALGMNQVYGDKIAQSMRDMAVNLGIITGKEGERARALQAEAVKLVENLDITYSANSAESMRLNILKQEVSLQGEINAKYDELDSYQRSILENEQYKLDILKQQNLATTERIGSLQNSSQELQDSMAVSLHDDDDWQTDAWAEIEAWNEKYKNLTKAPYKIKVDIEQTSNVDQTFRSIINNLDELAKKQASIKLISEEFINLKNSAGLTDQTMRELITSYDSSINVASMDSAQLEAKLEEIRQEAIESSGAIRTLARALEIMGANPQTINQYIAQLRQLDEELARGEISQEKYSQQIEKINTMLRDGIPAQRDWASTLVQAGTTLSQVSIGINGLNSLGQTLKEVLSGDVDAITAFTKILTSLTMILPTVASLAKAVSLANAQNAVQFLATGAAAGTGAAGVASFSAALSALLPIIGLVVIAGAAIVAVIQAIHVNSEEAREKIQKATDAYQEQVSTLESLNSKLKTTKDRIDELNNQDTLTVVEAEELDKLKQQEESLERQIKLQEKLNQETQKAQAEEIAKNYNKSTKDIAKGPDTRQQKTWTEDNSNAKWYKDLQKNSDMSDPYIKSQVEEQRYTSHVDEYVDADTWFKSVTQGLEETSDAYQDYLAEYQQWKDNNEQITAEWVADNSEAIQQAEDNYKSYVDAIASGAIDLDPDTLAAMQERLAEIRKSLYSSDGEYEQIVLEPILDDQAVQQISDQLYGVLSNGDVADAAGLISDAVKNELMLAGVSVDEFLEYVNNKVDETKAKVQEKFSDFDFSKLSGDDWKVLMTVNIDNFDSVQELKNFLDNYQENNVNVDVTGIEQLQEVLDYLNKSEDALETALKSYKDQEGYLTMDQVEALIAADDRYAQYIIKVGDAYKLTNQSLQTLLESERQESQALDAMLDATKDKYSVNKDYVDSYIRAWDELADRAKAADAVSKYNFMSEEDADLFRQHTEDLSLAAELYKDGEMSATEYFDVIGDRIDKIGTGFQELRQEIDDTIEETDLFEATLTAATGSIADGLADLNKQFKSGSINMDDYYKGTISATKALISSQGKLDKYIEKTDEGIWQLKEGIDETTVSADDYSKATSDIANLNAWEKQVSQAESLQGMVDTLVDHYDYFSKYMDDFGNIKFSVDNNFDTTAQEFQSMCSDVGAQLAHLEQYNHEAYLRIVKDVIDAGGQVANGLSTTSAELTQFMASSGANADMVLQSTMSECSGTIGTLSQAAGSALSALGDLIQNFSYKLSFKPVVVKQGAVKIKEWLKGQASMPFELPQLGLEITGSGTGGAMSNFANSLKQVGSFLSSSNGVGQGGGKDYGLETPSYNPNGVLDPNSVKSDNIRDKGSGGKKGKGGGGGGDKGKTYDKEELKDLDDVEDRYHNINRQIERQDDLLDDLDNKIERAWGSEALNAYQEKLQELQKQQELYNKKLDEARNYLKQDAALVKKYFAGAQIDANGEITNYEELLKKNLDLYNAAVKQYNLAVDGKTITEEQHTALKNKLDAEEKLFDKRQKALEKYEDTLDTIRDTTDDVQENARDIADTKLENIKFKLEIVLDVKSMKDTARDLAKDIADIFGDTLTQNFMGYDKLEKPKFDSPLALDAEAAKAEANLMPQYKQQYEELKALYDSTTDDAARRDIMDEISDLQGKIADSAKAIVEWANSIEDIVPDAVDAAAERFAAFTDQLDHNTSVLDTIKELYNLQGVTYKTASGFNRLQKVSQEKLEAQVASAKLQRGWYEEAAKRLETAQANLDALNGDENDIRYDALKKARDAYLEQFNDAQEAYLSSAQEAMETAQDMYLDQIERAVYKFGQAVSNGAGLDLLQDKYDHYIEQNERYFDKVNEAYQVSAWYNKLQKDIDDTTNSAHKERLKALQEEINQRREGNKLSQYDLDILNAKYQVLQAQMALEDAQNAKNQIQLTRDSQGNWNYQFTANQDDIANAQQKLLDAENEWYNIAKQQVTDVTGEIVDTWQECQDKIKDIYSDMTLTDEERSARAQEIYQYYTEKIKSLEEEKQNAIADMTEAGNKNLIDNAILTGDTITDVTGITSEELQQIVANSGESIKDLLLKNSEQLKDIVGDNTDLIDKFDNTYAKDLDNMTQNTTNFEEQLRNLLDEAQQHFKNYQDKVQDVASETGSTLDNLAKETDKVSESTDQLAQRGQEASEALWEQVTAAQQAADQYAALAAQIWEAVEAAKTLAAQMASNAASNSGLLYDKNTDYKALIEQGLVNGWFQYGDETFKSLVAQRDEKIKNEDKWKNETQGGEQFKDYTQGSNVGEWAQGRYDTKDEWNDALDKLKKNYGLATGGYTGTFEDAKLAFLHEKELVLNKEDTENILAAVQAVRTIGSDLFKSIEKSLDGNVVAAMNLMGQRLNPVSTMPTEDTIEQTVHIDKVEFPNVTSRSEIEEAFVSLTNDAAQWARRKT